MRLPHFPSFHPSHCFKVTVAPAPSFYLSFASISLHTPTDRLPPHCFIPPPHQFPSSAWGGGSTSSPQHRSTSLLPLFISLPPLPLSPPHAVVSRPRERCGDWTGVWAEATLWCRRRARGPFEKCQAVVCEGGYRWAECERNGWLASGGVCELSSRRLKRCPACWPELDSKVEEVLRGDGLELLFLLFIWLSRYRIVVIFHSLKPL